MTQHYNFSAGPAMLPAAVMRRAHDEFFDWGGTGTSVMEMSHRGDAFTGIAAKARADLRDLLNIPDNYTALFLQGGATLQFAMTVLNLADAGDTVDYVITGSWGKKAVHEASRFAQVNVVADGIDTQYAVIPDQDSWQRSSNAAFLHYTPNETIAGSEFHWTPEVDDGVPLVGDFSSTILSRPLDVSKFGVIYAGAQKNIGPAGLTLVIVRNDLLRAKREAVPAMLQYQTHADGGSMHNTPPTYSWYLAGLVFEWLKAEGGLAAMAQRNQRKAETVYSAIDHSDFYRSPVEVRCRSRMNVVFTLADPALDARFLSEAKEAGLLALKGHRSVGGMRASLYNAMPQAGVDALVGFMRHFESARG